MTLEILTQVMKDMQARYDAWLVQDTKDGNESCAQDARSRLGVLATLIEIAERK